MESKKIDDLEHKILEEKIESLKTKIYEGFRSINNSIENGFKLSRAENKRQNEISNIQRDEIIKRQDVTNGRVKELERVTSIIKFMRENKKLSILIFYAVYNILQIASPENILKALEWMKFLI